jgi:hypothetical protein
MVTINLSPETKERFKRIKLNISAKEGKSVSEDDLLKILLDKFEEVKILN